MPEVVGGFSGDEVTSERANLAAQARHGSTMRARVAAVVSLGSTSAAKKPWAMISPLGTGAAVWRNARTTKSAT